MDLVATGHIVIGRSEIRGMADLVVTTHVQDGASPDMELAPVHLCLTKLAFTVNVQTYAFTSEETYLTLQSESMHNLSFEHDSQLTI